MKNQEFEFLLEGYKATTSYYDSYMGRIWNRFNIMVTLDSALLALFMTLWFDPKSPMPDRLILFPIVGIIFSALMYAQSAQDRFIVGQLRGQINTLKAKIALGLDLVEDEKKGNELPMLFSPFAALKDEKAFIFEGVTSWRVKPISVTRIPALSSLIFVLIWIALIVMILVS